MCAPTLNEWMSHIDLHTISERATPTQMCKLSRLNQLRLIFCLESNSNSHLIDFFDLNSLNPNQALRRNG